MTDHAAQIDALRSSDVAAAIRRERLIVVLRRITPRDLLMSPVLDPEVLGAALGRGLPFVPGALSPTEIDAAWRAGSTFVKLFPASSVGPSHVRELRGPLGEIELIPTGGVDGRTAAGYLAAGAVAVGVGGAIVNATPADRAGLVVTIRAAL
jgi:2-dehydro-3-deoxyphosphogluconate aldolase/(4S)-4-hydroxy-2-oxoglutarate aldolase